ncbi:SIS domain-containing protein [Sphingomonas sp. FW199]|uniref:SIS domain-containing protein n=1 Tax=Sphingomonas sp. FW199 TaxID=3400217 RepID=UPI003CF037B5
MGAASSPSPTLMSTEAGEAADRLAHALKINAGAVSRLSRHLRQSPPRMVITCARGSSDHAATYAKYLIETLIGTPVSSAAPSVSSVYGADIAAEGMLLIAISQSGRSPDLLATVRRYAAAGATVVALVNDEQSPLAEIADWLIPLNAGPEKSVAATKSFILSLAMLAFIVSEWSDDAALKDGVRHLPVLLRGAHDLDWSEMVDLLADATNLFVLSRGYGLGIAQEAALKLKETCGLHAEAFSSAEVRHGPMAIVGHGFPVIAFAGSASDGDDVRQVASEFDARDARMILADGRAGLSGQLPTLRAHPAIEPLLMVQSFYAAAEALSRRRGFNPDEPPFLRKVTETR